tara:strand:+ start:1530 stop:1640 length:111 start_codon:yes stop_codon:yes gene_type:complete
MQSQDHHRYKDTRDKWAYAKEKVIKNHNTNNKHEKN